MKADKDYKTTTQTDAVEHLKDLEQDFMNILYEVGDTREGQPLASRNLSLAKTHFEDALMRVKRHYYRGGD